VSSRGPHETRGPLRRGASDRLLRLRRLWEEHVHRPFPGAGSDPRLQEVALYSTWLGSIVEVALLDGALNPNHAEMLKIRRLEGNQALFRAGGELGEPVRSYVARMIAIEDLLAELPIR
jgi:hypothetical protein